MVVLKFNVREGGTLVSSLFSHLRYAAYSTLSVDQISVCHNFFHHFPNFSKLRLCNFSDKLLRSHKFAVLNGRLIAFSILQYFHNYQQKFMVFTLRLQMSKNDSRSFSLCQIKQILERFI